MNKSEKWYQEEFLKLASTGDVPAYIEGSSFYREIPFSYEMDSSAKGGPYMPNASIDFIEIDSKGYMHIWEAKKLNSYELTSGRVIGQLMFYDWLMKTYSPQKLATELEKRKAPEELIRHIEKQKELTFKSWNILVCGGYGYELAAGFNPAIWNYTSIGEQYFSKETPGLSIHQMYHADEKLLLESIWKMSLFAPLQMEQNAFWAYLKSTDNEFFDYEVDKDGNFRLIYDSEMPLIDLDKELSNEKFLSLIGRDHLVE